MPQGTAPTMKSYGSPSDFTIVTEWLPSSTALTPHDNAHEKARLLIEAGLLIIPEEWRVYVLPLEGAGE